MRVIKHVEFNLAIYMNSMQEQVEIENCDPDKDTTIGTGGSASNGRNTNRDGEQHKSLDDYIKELKAEIVRLKADSGKARRTPWQHQHRD
jgi:hypothetical protein